jgi:high-affinity Fe2+/Pb2+ permease
MATKAKGASSSRKTNVSNGDYPLPPIFVASDSVHKQDWENVVGWIACCVLVILLLPVLGMLYMDVLQAKHEAKQQQEKVQKLIKQVEREKQE